MINVRQGGTLLDPAIIYQISAHVFDVHYKENISIGNICKELDSTLLT